MAANMQEKTVGKSNNAGGVRPLLPTLKGALPRKDCHPLPPHSRPVSPHQLPDHHTRGFILLHPPCSVNHTSSSYLKLELPAPHQLTFVPFPTNHALPFQPPTNATLHPPEFLRYPTNIRLDIFLTLPGYHPPTLRTTSSFRQNLHSHPTNFHQVSLPYNPPTLVSLTHISIPITGEASMKAVFQYMNKLSEKQKVMSINNT